MSTRKPTRPQPIPRQPRQRPGLVDPVVTLDPVQELSRLYQNMANRPENGRFPRWAEQADQVIYKCLEVGQDEVFEAALTRLEQEGEPEALADLGDDIEWAATHRSIRLLSGEAGWLSLFAIPLLVMSQASTLEALRELHARPALKTLAQSVRAHGLIGETPTLGLVPTLYRPEELASLGWSGLWHLGPRLHEEVLLGHRHDPRDMGQAAPAEYDAGVLGQHGSMLELRYLVGFLVDQQPQEFAPPELGEENPEADEEARLAAYAARQLDWCLAAAPLIESLLDKVEGEVVEAMTFPPLPVFEAMHSGPTLFEHFILQTRLEGRLREVGRPARAAWVLVVPCGEDGYPEEFRLSVLDCFDNRLLFGEVRPILEHEEPEIVEAMLVDLVESCGFARVEVLDEVAPLDTCECCGEPVFLTPPDKVGHEASLRLQGNSTVH